MKQNSTNSDRAAVPESLRRFSEKSQRALMTLAELETKLDGLKSTIDKMEASVKKAKASHSAITGASKDQTSSIINELAQISGNLDKLQFSGVDSVITAELQSGQQPARERRKSLNKQAEALRERIVTLHADLI